MAQFTTLDLVILVCYLGTILYVGLKASQRVKTLHDYATGGRSYTAFFVFATLSSSFIGGGFTLGLAEKVFTMGLVYVVALWGFSLKELLVASVIAPRMKPFRTAVSVGDIMTQLYGQQVGVFTGVAATLVCAGIAGAQFSGFGYIVNVLTGIPQHIGMVVAAGIVITYSTMGGMRSVVANDVVHFCVLIFALPVVLFFGLYTLGGWEPLVAAIPADHFSFVGTLPYWAIFGLFLNFFFGETLVPPYVQRLLIGKDLQHTARGTLWSGLLSIPFFLMIGLIGLVGLALSPDLNPNLALPYVINTVMPVGLKGLAIAGMMAVVMSSADSFLNAAAVSATHDVLRPFKRMSDQQEMNLIRLATFLVGTAGVVFALSTKSVLEILLNAYNFWTPFILVPLVGGLLGYKASARTFWISSFVGIIGMLLGHMLLTHTQGRFDAALIGIALNFVTFSFLRLREQEVVPMESGLPAYAPRTGTDG